MRVLGLRERWGLARITTELSDPAHEDSRIHADAAGRVRCSDLFGGGRQMWRHRPVGIADGQSSMRPAPNHDGPSVSQHERQMRPTASAAERPGSLTPGQ